MAAPCARNARPSLVFGRTTLLGALITTASKASPKETASARTPLAIPWPAESTGVGAVPAAGTPGISVDGGPKGCPTQRSAAAVVALTSMRGFLGRWAITLSFFLVSRGPSSHAPQAVEKTPEALVRLGNVT